MNIVLTGLIIVLASIILIMTIKLSRTNKKLKCVITICENSQDLNVAIQLDKLIENIVDTSRRTMRANFCVLYLVDDKEEKFYSDVNFERKLKEKQDGILKLIKEVIKENKILNISDNNGSILIAPIQSNNKIIGCLSLINKPGESIFTKEDEDLILYLIEIQIAPNLEKSKLYERLRMTFVDSIEAMVSAIDAKDEYTEGHCRRVSQNAVKLGRYIGLEEEVVEQLEYAGILHDIGKIGIKDNILNKMGPLNQVEYDIMKTHPIVGANILEQITTLSQSVRDGVRYHHERYDGTGYCEGLKGEEIPLFARILAIVDTYDAMTTDRIYRKRFTQKDALEEIRKGAGKQFDPYIVTMFIHEMGKKAN